jgi:ABC-2 type transport system ATP-binding protein
MRILTTQIEPNEGSARVLGLDVRTQGQQVRRLVGYVPQEMSVWTDITAYENLLIYSQIYGIPKTERKALIADALERMDLSQVKDNLVNTFSGGMIRRLEIACALIVKPKIVFLDEPTIGLDPTGRRKVWEKIVKFTKESGATVFFSTHYMDEADSYADEIAIINAGRIVGQGDSAHLKAAVGNQEVVAKLKDKPSPATISKVKALEQSIQAKVNQRNELEVWVKDADAAIPQIVKSLDASKCKVLWVRENKPSLEDAFEKYAGKTFERAENVRDLKATRRRIAG